MRERDIESRIREKITDWGGLFFKFVSPGNDGVPDRIAVLPDGQVWFLELKTDRGRLAPLQEWQIDRLWSRGANVSVIRGREEADDWLEERRTELALKGCLEG